MTHPPGDRPRRIAAAHDVVGGRYRLRESLGGSRVVWRAHDDLLDREVAVREVGTPPGSTSSEILDRQLATMLEALAAGAVDHPGIVPVLDVVWRPDRCWIVMAYVPGRSLREAVEADGPLDRRTAAATGLALLGALRAAHAAGLAHGDVRPGTVLLADDGRVLLTDFGLGGTGGSAAGDVLALASTIAAAVSDVDRVTVGGSADGLEDRLRAIGATRRVVPRQRTAPASTARPVLPTAEQVATAPVLRIRRPGQRRVRIVVAALAVLVLAGVVAIALTLRHGPPPATTVEATVRTAPPSPSPAVSAGCRLGDAVAGSTVGAVAVHQGYALPPGWLWYADRGGLVVAVPDGWLRTVDGSVTCFRDPDGDRLLAVDTAAPLTARPMAEWQRVESAELAAGGLPGYRAVGMSVLSTRQGGADWEYTWQGGDGQRLHEHRVLLAMGGGRAYAVSWATLDQDWTINRPFEQLVLASLE